VAVTGIETNVRAAFIRAPIVEEVSADVEVIASLPSGQIVGVRQGKVIGISFHPEVYKDPRIHRLLVDSI
jgi:5'-phosphate synthase pdxT subunit